MPDGEVDVLGLSAPEPHRADVQIRALRPGRRLELDDAEPPPAVVDPGARAPALDEAHRPQGLACRRRQELRVRLGRSHCGTLVRVPRRRFAARIAIRDPDGYRIEITDRSGK